MSVERIEPIRVVPARPARPLREREEHERDPRRHFDGGEDDEQGDAESDDGLPHVDVRA